LKAKRAAAARDFDRAAGVWQPVFALCLRPGIGAAFLFRFPEVSGPTLTESPKPRRMITITTTEALAAFCARAASQPYITVDTEFLRERTYYSKLCLIQLALPGTGDEDAVLVDPIVGETMDLAPLYALFRNEAVVKVFHAARQDLEIFFVEGGVIPHPLFDTQVAAMVCGFGEQVGYETLVRKLAKAQVDKTSRFTDWSRRPLSEAQKAYALADVTHLRTVYEALEKTLHKSKRQHWVEEEMAVLTDPETYVTRPEDAWLKVRTRTNSARFLAIVRELARFRESFAQTRNVPRSRVLKDDALLEVASLKPADAEALGRARLLLREARKGDVADGILAAVKTGVEAPQDSLPKLPPSDQLQVNPALADLLRVLLKAKAEAAGVASKLIATASDLDALAAGKRDVAALHGWRAEVFGDDAVKLCQGKLALAADGSSVRVIPL
jgi:ribonuclease D